MASDHPPGQPHRLVAMVCHCLYQGYGKQVDIHLLEHLNTVATKGREPDLTILLDIEAEKALDRKKSDLDCMEQLDLLRSARAAYISLSTRHAHRIKVIQADEPIHDIHRQIVHMVKKIIGP